MTKRRSKKSRSTKPRAHDFIPVAVTLAVVATAIAVWVATLPMEAPRAVETPVIAGAMEFTDVGAQARDFMADNRRIKLTRAQESVKRKALSHLRAACCSDLSAYTCCCQCNLSRTVWGLANHLIAEEGFGAEQVSVNVTEWLHFVNPAGFSGNTCFNGGCGRPFGKDGCGGMSESQLVL